MARLSQLLLTILRTIMALIVSMVHPKRFIALLTTTTTTTVTKEDGIAFTVFKVY